LALRRGVGSYDTSEWTIFSHTVFVDMRERLRRSTDPDRVFAIVLDAAKAAGLVGRKRVLDSTPLYDAVATMDTITLIRSAVRNLLKVTDGSLRAEVLAVLTSGDDYASSDKPQIDWRTPQRASVSSTLARRTPMPASWRSKAVSSPMWSPRRPPARDCRRPGLGRGRRQDLAYRKKGRKRQGHLCRGPEARHGHKTRRTV